MTALTLAMVAGGTYVVGFWIASFITGLTERFITPISVMDELQLICCLLWPFTLLLWLVVSFVGVASKVCSAVVLFIKKMVPRKGSVSNFFRRITYIVRPYAFGVAINKMFNKEWKED